MRRREKIGVCFLLWILLLCSSVLEAKGLRKVIIDAGHGGKDSGTVTRKKGQHNEKVIALAIAKKLGSYIEKQYPKVQVVYTRKTDVYLTLNKRAEIANKNNADLFISIHVDAVGSSKVRGASVYVLGLHRSEDNLKVAMRENAVMMQEDDYQTKYAGFDPKDAESYIIFSLMQNQYLDNSMVMASLVNKHLKTTTKRRTKGVKQAGFYVLREVGMPSVLIETGYITNPSDAAFLNSARGQQQIASSIFKAFKEYKNYIDGHTADLTNVPVPDTQNHSDTDTYFTVQVMYSGKSLPTNYSEFKGLSPIYKHKEGNAYRYTYGKTKSYAIAQELQRKARKKITGAYLVGYTNGKKCSVQKVRDILNGKR